ncbi:MAG: dihydrodipicolinate synthase family protein [Puniceicoccales bacterium]|jgi:N-acetylneuraminate lyase|nr:dihydrodipicolinate synthase family protein [Puniceicoccales bacterium]
MSNRHLQGLIPATHTPFNDDGSLNLQTVEKQAAHLAANGADTVFIGGSTGESHSLTHEERIKLATRWLEIAKGSSLRVIVHVGGNCLEDVKALSAHAGKNGAHAISALAPCYFKPQNVDALVDWCAAIAASAPALPFYFYDIPVLTGVNLPMVDFLEKGSARIPNLAGIKYTSLDLVQYQQCRLVQNGRFDLPWGVDETLISAMALGATSAVGSTYNFAMPLYKALLDAVKRGDSAAALEAQTRSLRLVMALARHGYMGSAKALMGWLGVPLGPARLPNKTPTASQLTTLRAELEEIGYCEWGHKLP